MRTDIRKVVLCAALCLSGHASLVDADVRFVPGKAVAWRIPDQAHVRISGEITDTSPRQLREALAQASMLSPRSSTIIVVLDSPGGSVPAALEMGRILRSSLAHTIVDGGGVCSSSCVFLLAGGATRNVFLDGKIGLHRPRFEYEPYANLPKDQARDVYGSLINQCNEYMKEMGISEKVFSDMLRVPSQKIRFVDPDYAEAHSLVGVDPGYEEWARARDIKSKGEGYVKARDRLLDCLNKGTAHSICQMRYQNEISEGR